MGHRVAAGLTWLCYTITQPVGRPPVKCLAALMNGRNTQPCITTRHATHSLMVSGRSSKLRLGISQSTSERAWGGGGGRGVWLLVAVGRETAVVNAPFPMRHSRP